MGICWIPARIKRGAGCSGAGVSVLGFKMFSAGRAVGVVQQRQQPGDKVMHGGRSASLS